MQLFLHTLKQVRIINEPLEWSGTPEEFQALEPQYVGLPSGASIRYQTPDLRYYEDAAGRHEDIVNCLGYCLNVSQYLINGCIWVHVMIDTPILDITDLQAVIHVNAYIKGTSDPNGTDLPVNQTWIIRPWHESGDRDALWIAFVNGVANLTYTYRDGLALGDWFIREEDFNTVTVGNVTYRVLLAQPVKYTLYRT